MCLVPGVRNSQGGVLCARVIDTLCFYPRGSWLTIHAHPMPWLGLPTASWPRAAIGGLWPMGRKATCYRLLIIAATRTSGSSPQPQRVPAASLLCWGAMTGGRSFQLRLLPAFRVHSLPQSSYSQPERETGSEPTVRRERFSGFNTRTFLFCSIHWCIGSSKMHTLCCVSVPLPGDPQGVLSTFSVFPLPLFRIGLAPIT